MKNRTVVINKNTFCLLTKKFFTRQNKLETSDKYKTFFPSLKYYSHLSGEIDAIRINKKCLFNQVNSFFCIQESYWNAEKTKHYQVIYIHPNSQTSRAARGLSDFIPAPILRAISWAEDFKNDKWVQNAI